MATTSITNTTSTEVLARASAQTDSFHAVWFQNYDTTNIIRVECGAAAGAASLAIAPASSATNPTTLIIQDSGGDTTLTKRAWNAYQASGGTITTFLAGRW